MNEVIYVNRYNDQIKFTELNDKQYLVSGENIEYVGMSQDKNGNLMSWDPVGGGPFIALGYDVNVFLMPHKRFLEQDHKKVIKKLENTLEGLIITFEKEPIKNHPNNVKEKNSSKKGK